MARLRNRFAASTPELDRAEADWWARYSEVEERFCWVQPPPVRSLLRRDYVRQIVDAVPPGGRVLEIGCGTGWLSLLIAREGDVGVHGIDMSPEQVRRAECLAREAGLSERASFHLAGAGAPDSFQLLGAGSFDVVVIHGVLHHLSNEEVHRLLADLLQWAPGARAFLVEPVLYPPAKRGALQKMLERLIDRLILWPRMGQRSRVRRVGLEEATLQRLVDERGDSPKETPFVPGELERLVSPAITVQRSTPVLLFSYLAAKNLLLMQLTYPRLITWILLPYLSLVRSLERWMARRGNWPSSLPVFVMFEGVIRAADASTGLAPRGEL